MRTSMVSAQALLHRPVIPDVGHRVLREGEFWKRIPAYRDVDEATFLDHQFQSKHSVTRTDRLFATIGELVSDAFYKAVEEGTARASMSVRLTPYLLSLIDWEKPVSDPIRRQFLPLATEQLPDHPLATFDSLAEQATSPVEGLTHRYPDKALFLTQDRCPVYCRFCTRSYAVGLDTEQVEKVQLSARFERWERVLDYLRVHSEIEDVVISGGDSYSLRADHVEWIGHRLLDIPHIRRLRFATKGLAVMPMKVLTDDAWFVALTRVVQRGRREDKEVVVHTHFNHPAEITDITRRATSRLFSEGVTVRNQSVLLRGVNDDADVMRMLGRRLAYVNVHPYYVFQHDLVQGVEDLRTTLATAAHLEKSLRGSTAGFNTPTFVVDTPGGGGKRDVHSYEHYNQVTGISVFRSPNVDASKSYLYFDPIDQLSDDGQQLWSDPRNHQRMIEDALQAVR